MSADFLEQVAKKRTAEFERYYQELLMACARDEYKFTATGPMGTPLRLTFAEALAEHLQEKSGYICKAVDKACSHVDFEVVCKFRRIS